MYSNGQEDPQTCTTKTLVISLKENRVNLSRDQTCVGEEIYVGNFFDPRHFKFSKFLGKCCQETE